MVIEELDPEAGPEWDDYVSRKEGANCYHLHGWRRAGERAYGLRAPWLIARAHPRGEPLGVLPLFFVRSDPLRGYATTGLFGAYGPVLAEDGEIRALLIREACRRAREAGLASFRFKGLGEEPAAAGFASLDHWLIATLPLSATSDAAWASIRGRERNLVRKALRSGLEVRRGPDELPGFYDVLAENMHHKGAPIYGWRFVQEMAASFAGACEVVAIHHRNRCVAGAVTLTFKGVITVPFASSRPESLSLAPNVLLYWDIISRACGAGLRLLDLGTSLRGSSALRFKQHGGARTTPRSIQVLALRGRPPAMDAQSPILRAAISLWQKLPRAWADALGPEVCRRFLA